MRPLKLQTVVLYVTLLLALAALGSWNQQLLARQQQLISAKEALHRQLGDLRREAAAVAGPLAVRIWAQDHGMIPAPEGAEVAAVPPTPAPAPPTFETGLEVRTVWR